MKRITKRMLAVLLALVMVIGFVPGNLSVSVSAEGNNIIYVAPNDDPEFGDGTQEKPYASIQKAVDAVPRNNEVPTTILLADGAYNVYDASTPRGLIINKNVTVKAENPRKAILYSHSDNATVTAFHKETSTVRITNTSDVTLDGLVILPSLRDVKVNAYSIAVSANALRRFLGVAVEEEDKTLYMPHATNYGNVGTILVNNNYDGNNVSGNLVIQNCSIGYNDTTNTANGVASIFFMGAMKGCYLLQNNDFYNNLRLQNASVAGSVNKIVNNNLTYCSISINVSTQDSLPVIRDNAITANQEKVYGSVPSSNAWNYASILTVSKDCAYQYTDGERAVIGLSTTDKSGKYVLASYHNNTDGYMVFLSRASATTYADTTMDSQEELGYYLGKEGDVTLTQDFTITKAGILPEEILANVEYGEYKITKTEDLDLLAPEGYEWQENVLVKSAEPAWMTATLLLENDLNMKFYVDKEAYCAEGYTLKISAEGMDPITVPFAKWEQDGAGYYVAFEGIAATRMTKVITVQLYSGEEVVAEHTDSIRMYANRLKESAYGEDQSLMNLVTAVLNYGAAAQQYEGKGAVANEDLANYDWSTSVE